MRLPPTLSRWVQSGAYGRPVVAVFGDAAGDRTLGGRRSGSSSCWALHTVGSAVPSKISAAALPVPVPLNYCCRAECRGSAHSEKWYHFTTCLGVGCGRLFAHACILTKCRPERPYVEGIQCYQSNTRRRLRGIGATPIPRRFSHDIAPEPFGMES